MESEIVAAIALRECEIIDEIAENSEDGSADMEEVEKRLNEEIPAIRKRLEDAYAVNPNRKPQYHLKI